MDYYEELGIHPDATTGEIREAYKLAVRLVHPDKQLDPRLKKLAECQMKRLSDVVAVLVNPRERARYDAGLARGMRPKRVALLAGASRPELLQSALRHWFWVLLGSMAMGTGVWYVLAGAAETPAGIAPVESARAAAQPAVAQGERTTVRKRPERVAATTDTGRMGATLPERETPTEEPQPSMTATAPIAMPPAWTPTLLAKPEAGVAPVEQTEQPGGVRNGESPRFAGEWLFAAAAQGEERAGTYPARYVELRLREAGGTLAGDYRAVHRMLGKAISPEVAFRVSGESPQGTTAKLGWQSTGGAKGELELTLRSPDQLQVTWWTTQFGKQEALSSGMAVLMRLKTP
jgi:hypothetical protein